MINFERGSKSQLKRVVEEKQVRKEALGNFKKKAIEALKSKEGEAKLPQINIEIFYAPHITAKDLRGFKEFFKKLIFISQKPLAGVVCY